MFPNKKRTKLKQNKESKKITNKQPLKMQKIEERNKEQIEIMKEKINIIQEKLSLCKNLVSTRNKKVTLDKQKIERKISINEIQEKNFKPKNLLNTINISPNLQQKNDCKFQYQTISNNFYNKCKNLQSKAKISSREQLLNDSKNCLSNDKDYFKKKKKENNNLINKNNVNNKSNIYDYIYEEKNSKLKSKRNYSRDKENISFDKSNNFNSKENFDKLASNNIKKEQIQPYKIATDKNKNKNKKFSLLNEIKPNKSLSFSNKKIEDEINILLESNKEIENINKCPILDKLGSKSIINLSKETPSTRNTLKNEIKISENILNNKLSKISKENEKEKNSNKKDSLNKSINKNEASKKIRIIRCISKINIKDKNIKRKKNRSFEYKHKHNLNLSQLRNINPINKIKKSKNNKNLSTFCEKNLLSIISPKFSKIKHNIVAKSTKNNVPKNIITLRKPLINCKIEIPYEQFNPKKKNKIKFDINNNKPNQKPLKKKKQSSFDLSKSKINKFEEKHKNKIEEKNKIKKDKHSKKNLNRSTENLNVFNFKTIQNNFNEKEKINENEENKEKVIPHVFSAIFKRKGFKQKEYPNMALRMNSSQGNINIRKNVTPIYKEMKFIKDIEYICKRGFSGPGIKKTNQDNFFIYKKLLNNDNYTYIGVCDGHGIFGQDISSYLVNNLPQNLNNDLLNHNIKNISSEKLYKISQYIESSFIQTNIKLNTDERIDSTYSGSTCVSIIYTPKKLITINVGDSRCIIAKYNNDKWFPKILTTDHKPNLPKELERIISSGGKVEPFKDPYGKFVGPERVWKEEGEVPGLAMSRSFGDEVGHEVGVIVNPEINEYEFVNEDKFIILASDGVWEFISNEEVVDIVKDFYLNNDIKGALNFLYKEASKRWIMEEEIIDDITIILIFLN